MDECLQLASRPQASNAVGKDECQKSTTNGANLDHGRDVPFDIGVGSLVKLVEAEKLLKVNCIECTWIQALAYQ
jgi:hypothetical protein